MDRNRELPSERRRVGQEPTLRGADSDPQVGAPERMATGQALNERCGARSVMIEIAKNQPVESASSLENSRDSRVQARFPLRYECFLGFPSHVSYQPFGYGNVRPSLNGEIDYAHRESNRLGNEAISGGRVAGTRMSARLRSASNWA